MRNTIKISTYSDLISFLEASELSTSELAKVATEALKVVVFEEGKDKEELLQDIIIYIRKRSATGEKLVFLNLPDINVI